MRKDKYIYIFCSLCALLLSCGAERNVKKGDKLMAIGEYYDAAGEYKMGYRKTPPKERARRGQIANKLAQCYDHISSAASAVAAYRNVIRYKQDDGNTHLGLARNLKL